MLFYNALQHFLIKCTLLKYFAEYFHLSLVLYFSVQKTGQYQQAARQAGVSFFP